MKIAVLSDIHGNFQALESVMKDSEEHKCEKVLCLGDLAMAGPQPRAVIDYVRKQNNWIVIQGNTDKMIAEYTKETLENVRSNAPVMANALLDDILYIEKIGNKCNIVTTYSTQTSTKSLETLLSELPNYFRKCHRSYILNEKKIIGIDKKEKYAFFPKGVKCPINSYFDL